ncbi:unnamed protein product [Schistocephalus solidus]|uniref:Uncharacterized protein n=1 Tax=Schistocephalus solidus TaxID=70667 RepID=A0A183TU89_SCHSO|nr:unnamed protein product [Schistocephalus solidus]
MPSLSDYHLLLPSKAKESKMDVPPIEVLAAACLSSCLELRSAGRHGDRADPQRQRLDGSPPRQLQDEAPTAASQETTV